MRVRTPLTLVSLVAASVLLAGCGAGGSTPQGAAPSSPSGSSSTSSATAVDPDTPSSWGPTLGEIEQGQELAAAMSPAELAGQVIVGRYDGTDPAIPGQMVRDLHLAGVCVTSGNVTDAEQVRATTAAITEAHAADGRDWPAVIGVDEEGGVVSHLRGIATEFPAFATAGVAIAGSGKEGEQAVEQAARTTALELRDLGFSWVFAPVADVTIGAADPTIGTRSPSGDPALASRAIRAAVTGYDEAGLVSTTKHFPGHGGVTADSHETLPVLGSSLEELQARDLVPFEAAVKAGAPSVMVAHLDVEALDPGVPSSQSAAVYDYLRDDLGFEGVAITDSLGMGAALAQDFPAIRALQAGADLLLMPVDTYVTHDLVVKAIRSGEVPRSRVEEAAARVIALQLWQQRIAGEVPVPADVTTLAQEAAANLAMLGS